MTNLVRSSVTLRPLAPFRLDATVMVLRRDERNIVDRWEDGRYTRLLSLPSGPSLVVVEQTGPLDDPEVTVSLMGAEASASDPAIASLKLVLGMNVDLKPFYIQARGDPVLRDLVAPVLGLKPPRFPSLFEALVNAVACQQISLAAGITLMGRLAQRFGPRLRVRRGEYLAFPEPSVVAAASQEELRELGFSGNKARCILALSQRLAEGDLNSSELEGAPNDGALASLQELPGIGAWSAEYVLLRGLGRLDVFPAGDVGAARNLARLFGMDEKPRPGEVRQIVARWRPWSGLVYLHLLARSLVERGRLQPAVPGHLEGDADLTTGWNGKL
jgi:DNA-3-methyladenine glycosylase II